MFLSNYFDKHRSLTYDLSVIRTEPRFKRNAYNFNQNHHMFHSSSPSGTTFHQYWKFIKMSIPASISIKRFCLSFIHLPLLQDYQSKSNPIHWQLRILKHTPNFSPGYSTDCLLPLGCRPLPYLMYQYLPLSTVRLTYSTTNFFKSAKNNHNRD